MRRLSWRRSTSIWVAIPQHKWPTLHILSRSGAGRAGGGTGHGLARKWLSRTTSWHAHGGRAPGPLPPPPSPRWRKAAAAAPSPTATRVRGGARCGGRAGGGGGRAGRGGVSSARPLPPCACHEVVRESHLRASPCPIPPPARPAPGARQNVKGGPLVLRDGNPCGCLCVSFGLTHLVLQFLCRTIHFEKSTPGTTTDLYNRLCAARASGSGLASRMI